MLNIPRSLKLTDLTRKKSLFLFGPRSTGKSFWIKSQFGDTQTINLLRANERRRFLENPSLLASFVNQFSTSNPIIIDEIQLVPELLDEVHALIESTDYRFLLTGSSARKLKRTNANMLGGRAKYAELFPLTWYELKQVGKFELEKYLLYGGIPRVYLSENPADELSDYIDTYLDQEIKAEAATRNIFGFELFLQKIAFASGETVVLQNLANDSQVSPPTVRNYIEVLEDTLIAYHLRPWKSPRRKAIQSAKIFIFDLGLKWALAGVDSLPEKSNLFGIAFEHFIINEVRANISYSRKKLPLYFWRTTHQDEVDLIVGDREALEIKASTKTSERDSKSLLKLRDENFSGVLIVVSRDRMNRIENGIEYIFWEDYLMRLWKSVS